MVLGASTGPVHALCQLHRVWTSRCWNLPRLHQWRETVSVTILSTQHFHLIVPIHIPFRCPARECHAPHKCRGHFIDSYKLANLEDCIRACNDNELCKWYTLEKSNDHCLLYEDCVPLNDCDTCASGEKSCSRGYHGRKNILYQTS